VIVIKSNEATIVLRTENCGYRLVPGAITQAYP
jgi:hypothetical protein